MQKIVIINTRCANFSSVMMALKKAWLRVCCQ